MTRGAVQSTRCSARPYAAGTERARKRGYCTPRTASRGGLGWAEALGRGERSRARGGRGMDSDVSLQPQMLRRHSQRPGHIRGTDSVPQFGAVLSRTFRRGRIKVHTLHPRPVFLSSSILCSLVSTLELRASRHHSHPASLSLIPSQPLQDHPHRSASHDLRPPTTSP